MRQLMLNRHVLRGVVMIAVYVLQSNFHAWALAPEGVPGDVQVDQATEDEISTKFATRLKELTDLSKEKNRWMVVFAGLESRIREVESALSKIEAKSVQDSNAHGAWRSQNRVRVAMSQMIGSYRSLQDLAVRQYALFLKLESLDQSLKQKVLSRADYISERANILGQIAQIEQLRLWENLAGDISFFLKDIADVISDVELAVKLSR